MKLRGWEFVVCFLLMVSGSNDGQGSCNWIVSSFSWKSTNTKIGVKRKRMYTELVRYNNDVCFIKPYKKMEEVNFKLHCFYIKRNCLHSCKISIEHWKCSGVEKSKLVRNRKTSRLSKYYTFNVRVSLFGEGCYLNKKLGDRIWSLVH